MSLKLKEVVILASYVLELKQNVLNRTHGNNYV